MTPSEYQQLSIQTAKRSYGMPNLAYYTLGLNDETGELMNKILDRPDDNEGQILELGDMVWYYSAILYEMHIDFGMVAYDYKPYRYLSPLGQMNLLVAELGKLTGAIKKLYRDDNSEMTFDRQKLIEGSMSIILGLFHAISRNLGKDLETVMIKNRQKLEDRVNREVRFGNGDSR